MPSPIKSQLSATSDTANIWLLPDGVTDLMSDEAQKQETLRYTLTRRLVRYGYKLICPPMIEYTESLLNNASEDLRRQTFKIIDQLTGRLMGVRADITPQILRIDAHLNQQHSRNHIARYCYAGHVIHTLPKGLFGSRTPLQLGAEIFGCDDIAADIELLDVLHDLLNSIELNAILHVDIGQVVIFERLCELSQISESESAHLMELYANKALPELEHLSQQVSMGSDFYALAAKGHDMAILKETLSESARQDSIIAKAMTQIVKIKEYLEQTWQCDVSIDITELSGYHYHTGLIFNVYLDNETQAVARGGRFDGMIIDNAEQKSLDSKSESLRNKSLSDKRPATGFSLDLTRLQNHINLPSQKLAIVDYDTCTNMTDDVKERLALKIKELRSEKHGMRVIKPLSAEDTQAEITHRLILKDSDWHLEAK